MLLATAAIVAICSSICFSIARWKGRLNKSVGSQATVATQNKVAEVVDESFRPNAAQATLWFGQQNVGSAKIYSTGTSNQPSTPVLV
jgi:hypothetical protein